MNANQLPKGLLFFVRILLVLSIISVIISCLLMLVFGPGNAISYGIMWFSIMGAGLIVYFSIIALIGIAVYYKLKKEKIWMKIKKETILLGISILCLLTLGVINNYIT